MKEHFLKFANKIEAISIIAANEPNLFWFDADGQPHIKNTHDFAICLVGDVYHATGNTLEDGSPEMILVDGYHVNLVLNGREFPKYLEPFDIGVPVTPSCTFGG